MECQRLFELLGIVGVILFFFTLLQIKNYHSLLKCQEKIFQSMVADVVKSHTYLKGLFFEYIKFSLCGVDPETSKAVDDLLSKFSRSNFSKLLGAMDLSDAMFLQSMERILFTSSSFQLPEKPSIKWKDELIENSRKIDGAIKVLEEAIERRNKEKNKE